MELKKLLLATILGGFGMWVIAGVWHNLIMAKLYEDVHATHDAIGILLIAYLVLSLLMSHLYSIVFKGKRPISTGAKLGVVIGVTWVLPHGLAMAGAHGDSILYVFKNTAWHIVEQGVGGMIIGFIYCKTMRHVRVDATCSTNNT